MTAIRQRFAALCLAALAVAAPIAPSSAAWIAGRGVDVSGATYLALVNDAETGERIELNCTPAGQAFLAVTWNAAGEPHGSERLSLRFSVSGSHRFAAAARFRALDQGWGAAELDVPDIISPLTEALAVASGELEVEIVGQGGVISRALFDMAKAREAFAFYRSYCHMRS